MMGKRRMKSGVSRAPISAYTLPNLVSFNLNPPIASDMGALAQHDSCGFCFQATPLLDTTESIPERFTPRRCL